MEPMAIRLEPISNLFEEHGDARELDNPKEIGGAILPACKKSSLPLRPGKEPFDEPMAINYGPGI